MPNDGKLACNVFELDVLILNNAVFLTGDDEDDLHLSLALAESKTD